MASHFPRYHVYLLRSIRRPEITYVGITDDVDRRVSDHNSGRGCAHTARYRPWEVVAVISVSDRKKACRLETYLKSGSGHAFRNRHLF